MQIRVSAFEGPRARVRTALIAGTFGLTQSDCVRSLRANRIICIVASVFMSVVYVCVYMRMCVSEHSVVSHLFSHSFWIVYFILFRG